MPHFYHCSTGQLLCVEDPERLFETLFRQERALDRAIDFTNSFVVVGNVLGDDARTSVSQWAMPEARDYQPKRVEPWDAEDRRGRQGPPVGGRARNLPTGEGEPPQALLDTSRLKHSRIETVSLIRESLWNQAGWFATGFVQSEVDAFPPVLALIYRDESTARQIFSQWRSELGARDLDELLRITIIRGIDRANPHAYRVAIGANPRAFPPSEELRYVGLIFRLCTMQPESGVNLARFLRSYEALRRFHLAPGVLRPGARFPDLFPELALAKQELNVREAWQLGRHDVDSCGIREDDDPLIPQGEDAAPVLDLLRWKRNRRR